MYSEIRKIKKRLDKLEQVQPLPSYTLTYGSPIKTTPLQTTMRFQTTDNVKMEQEPNELIITPNDLKPIHLKWSIEYKNI